MGQHIHTRAGLASPQVRGIMFHGTFLRGDVAAKIHIRADVASPSPWDYFPRNFPSKNECQPMWRTAFAFDRGALDFKDFAQEPCDALLVGPSALLRKMGEADSA